MKKRPDRRPDTIGLRPSLARSPTKSLNRWDQTGTVELPEQGENIVQYQYPRLGVIGTAVPAAGIVPRLLLKHHFAGAG